jgi:hypothetical protein
MASSAASESGVSIRTYALVTGAYWAFTLTDGALRMLVLLHFYTIGYDAFQIALLFLLYEFCGVLTNLLGGWLGSRVGLKSTLFSGLALQVVALLALSRLDPDWAIWASVLYVMVLQALSGIAKDLTKMSSKSAVKLVVSEGEDRALFKWVAILTGSKNALKGAGFFLGGALLAWLGFVGALYAMAALVAAALIGAALFLTGDLGRAKDKVPFKGLFSKTAEINTLSAARFFLFGARDIWFVVGLPLFLAAKLGWSEVEVGAYMAAWVIGYGFVQAAAPKMIAADKTPGGATSRHWLLWLIAVTVAITGAQLADFYATWVLTLGLILFGAVFAVNSSVHSYLILAYTDADKVALNVGFYYMANAGGRLAGTILSGLAYMAGGIVGCLTGAAIFLVISWAISLGLPEVSGRADAPAAA